MPDSKRVLLMDRMLCPECGLEHDLSDLEPGYAIPDAFCAVPRDERDSRILLGTDDCRIRDANDTRRQYFLRALLPIPIRGEAETCSWGIWVEVDEATFARVRELWDAPQSIQRAEPPFKGFSANTFDDYIDSLGLPGTLQLTGPTTAPVFTLARDLDHPLAVEQREGVYPERVLEWLVAHFHDEWE